LNRNQFESKKTKEKLFWRPAAEINRFSAYNQMVGRTRNSAVKLAQSERELGAKYGWSITKLKTH
jgi:hypothetical protein